MGSTASSRYGPIVAMLGAMIAGVGSEIGLLRTSSLQADVTDARAEVRSVIKRIEISDLEPAKPVDVTTVVRDLQDMSEPIARTEPPTVEIEMSLAELVAEIADGTTCSFWTSGETVPGLYSG